MSTPTRIDVREGVARIVHAHVRAAFNEAFRYAAKAHPNGLSHTTMRRIFDAIAKEADKGRAAIEPQRQARR